MFLVLVVCAIGRCDAVVIDTGLPPEINALAAFLLAAAPPEEACAPVGDFPLLVRPLPPEDFPPPTPLEPDEFLSEPFPFVRVDFYSIKNKLYVGEMTFHPGCGWESFTPSEWNRKMGDMLELPKEKWIEEDLSDNYI